MMNSRTRHRRAAARHNANDNGTSPSILELLGSYLTHRVARSAVRGVQRGVQEAVRWTVLRLLLGCIGTAILTAGILLLMGAGVEGLEALHCPLWLAYLSTGTCVILATLVAMKGIIRPREDEEFD